MSHTIYTATQPNTTFLYPKIEKYPVDKTCKKIVHALKKRNWKIPGMQVEFYDYGTGEQKYRIVWKIQGEDFKLLFCRIQGTINSSLNDIAAISEIVIPRKELHVYSDESIPTYYTYEGNNWENDKDIFVNGSENKSKINGKKKFNLRNESFKKLVFKEINEWLNINVLERIKAVEESTNVELTSEPNIPYPEHVGPFYLKIDQSTYNTILQGKDNINNLEPSDRYAIIGGGYRLLSLDIRNDGSFPIEAYNGFKYCSLKKLALKEKDCYYAVLSIKPKNANNIFVIDYEPALRYKRKCFEANSKKSMLTNQEYEEYRRCTARTLVPIDKYNLDYKEPMIVIGHSKEISFDEVEIIEVK